MEIKRVVFEPMNEVHDREVEVLKRLLDKIDNREDFEKEFKEFLEDVKHHFEFEEKLMKEKNFFAYIPHKMEHDRVLKELREVSEIRDYDKLKEYFYNTFIPWLENHVATMDTVTAGFFSMGYQE